MPYDINSVEYVNIDPDARQGQHLVTLVGMDDYNLSTQWLRPEQIKDLKSKLGDDVYYTDYTYNVNDYNL